MQTHVPLEGVSPDHSYSCRRVHVGFEVYKKMMGVADPSLTFSTRTPKKRKRSFNKVLTVCSAVSCFYFSLVGILGILDAVNTYSFDLLFRFLALTNPSNMRSIWIASVLATVVLAAPSYAPAAGDNEALSQYFQLLAEKVKDRQDSTAPAKCDLTLATMPQSKSSLVPFDSNH
jgi:hypothetical protein